MGILYVAGAILTLAGVVALVGLLIGAIFNLQVSASSRRALWEVFAAGTLAGVGMLLALAFWRHAFYLLWILNAAGTALVVVGVIAALGLLIGAIFDLGISQGSRDTLWRVFWTGLLAGLALVYGPQLLRLLLLV